MTAQEPGSLMTRLRQLGSEFFDWAVYRTTFVFGSILGLFYIRLRLSGVHCFPLKGPVLLVSNHQSFIDPLFLGLAMPRRAKYAARSTLIRGVFGRYLLALGAIPINREAVSLSTFKTMIGALGKRDALVYFPEGTRTPDGNLLPLKKGVGLLVRRAKAPVVICGIAGAYESWPRRSPIPLPGTMWMHFQSWSLDELSTNSEEELMESIARRLKEATDEAYRRREIYMRQMQVPILRESKNTDSISAEPAGTLIERLT